MFGFKLRKDRKTRREYAEIEKEIQMEDQENERIKKLWQENYNIVASQNGLQPYIEKIQDQLPANAVNKGWTKSIEYAQYLLGGYYEELKSVGAPDQLMLAAYGQYLWETYILKVVRIRILQRSYKDCVQLLDKAQNDTTMSSTMRSIIQSSVETPLFLKHLVELGSEAYFSLVSNNALDYNGNHLVDTLSINSTNQHAYTPVDAFKAYWEYVDGSSFMTRLLNADENVLSLPDAPIIPLEEMIRFTYNGREMFNSSEIRDIKAENLDVYSYAVEFLSFICTKWADDIRIIDFCAIHNPKISAVRMPALTANTKQMDKDLAGDYADYMLCGATWRMFDIYEFFGYSYDNMPPGWSNIKEGGQEKLDQLVQITGAVRDYERFPEGCSARFLPQAY